MRDRMAHRGPDGVGIWGAPGSRAAGSGTGGYSVACIDLSSGRRRRYGERPEHGGGRPSTGRSTTTPKFEQRSKRTVKCTLADESLRHGNAVARLRRVGPRLRAALYGMFAFAVYDGREPGRPAVHLVRDRVGIKPMCVTQDVSRRVAVRLRRFGRSSRIRSSRPTWTAPPSVALPDVHRRARAVDDVPGDLQDSGRAIA